MACVRSSAVRVEAPDAGGSSVPGVRMLPGTCHLAQTTREFPFCIFVWFRAEQLR